MTIEQKAENLTVLKAGLDNSLRILHSNLVARGGETKQPVRDRPNLDYVTLLSASSLDDSQDEVKLDLYANGLLGIFKEGVAIPIGFIEQDMIDELLYLYAMLKDKDLADSIEREGVTKGIEQKDLSSNGDEVTAELMPHVDRYVEQHREKLTIKLTQEVAAALKRVIAQPVGSTRNN